MYNFMSNLHLFPETPSPVVLNFLYSILPLRNLQHLQWPPFTAPPPPLMHMFLYVFLINLVYIFVSGMYTILWNVFHFQVLESQEYSSS